MAHKPIKSTKVIFAIKSIVQKGTGVEHDPYRDVTQYWTTGGEFIAEHDPVKDDSQ